ncbi:MAG: DUF4349 domain-containing protein [Thermaurantimonas sp.]|uniref:DUF4349 domain-containing protein n=1 Tax=Thermaurantimonas sp. TaxID=2681568 RepID=UPI00391A23B7
MKTNLLLALVAFFFLSCNQENDSYDASMSSAEMAESRDLAGHPNENVLNSDQEFFSERLLIKNGSIRFKTNDFQTSRKVLFKLIEKFKGIVQNESTDRYDNSINLYIDCKIPSKHFDAFVDTLEGVFGRPESRNIRIEDITKHYRDTEARIQTKKELENRYRELLKQAKTVSEILEIEAKLNEVRYEIEQYEQMIKNYDNQLAYSSLNISLYQESRRELEFFKKVGDGIYEGWDNFLRFLIGIVHLWPFVILILVVVYLLKFRRKK